MALHKFRFVILHTGRKQKYSWEETYTVASWSMQWVLWSPCCTGDVWRLANLLSPVISVRKKKGRIIAMDWGRPRSVEIYSPSSTRATSPAHLSCYSSLVPTLTLLSIMTILVNGN